MITILVVTMLIITCIALRSKGLWDKKIKDVYKLDKPDVEVSEVRIGTIVKIIIYGLAVIMFPVMGIAFIVIFEILPWAFRSKKAE